MAGFRPFNTTTPTQGNRRNQTALVTSSLSRPMKPMSAIGCCRSTPTAVHQTSSSGRRAQSRLRVNVSHFSPFKACLRAKYATQDVPMRSATGPSQKPMLVA